MPPTRDQLHVIAAGYFYWHWYYIQLTSDSRQMTCTIFTPINAVAFIFAASRWRCLLEGSLWTKIICVPNNSWCTVQRHNECMVPAKILIVHGFRLHRFIAYKSQIPKLSWKASITASIMFMEPPGTPLQDHLGCFSINCVCIDHGWGAKTCPAGSRGEMTGYLILCAIDLCCHHLCHYPLGFYTLLAT